MKNIVRVAIMLGVLPLSTCLAGAAPMSEEVAASAAQVPAQITTRVLEKMEYLRGLRGSGFTFNAEVATVENGAISEQTTLDVKIHEKGYALIELQAPSNLRGRRTLLRERDLWLYLPSSANIIRVAPLQRVFGSASIADVLNVSYLSGYTVESSRRSDTGHLLQINLKSKDADATYARIELEYNLTTDRPVQSRHYTASNRLLKTIQYKAFFDDHGDPKVEKITIVDALHTSSVLWMKMGQYRKANYPDSMFTKAALSSK